MAISLRHESRVQALEIRRQRLPVLFLRDFIHTHRRILTHAVIGSFQGRHIEEMCQRVEPSFGLSLRSFHYLQQFR